MAAGSDKELAAEKSSDELKELISELRKKHKMDLKNLTLTNQPFKTLKLFGFATLRTVNGTLIHAFSNGRWPAAFGLLSVVLGLLAINVGVVQEEHIQEFINYSKFVLWWVALGVVSSIGLGSGLPTFLLYLGPHVALFTIKAMKCGRVDLKKAAYDTIQLNSHPSWLQKECSEFGPPLFSSLPGSLVKIPISSLLQQVQLETILWGFGTALGELPPYFVSKAAFSPASEIDPMDDSDSTALEEDGNVVAIWKRVEGWLVSHSRHLNFFTILILAAVPNPFFDFAGILCGQIGVPFWQFFLATLIGKAIVKAHIQTIFVISVCNNQLLEWVKNKLVNVLGFIPGFASVIPNIIANLLMLQEKFVSGAGPASGAMAKQLKLFPIVWKSVILLVQMNFLAKIVTSTAQRYLRRKQELELRSALKCKSTLSTQ